MSLNSSGVYASIIILISLMLICHTANFLYPNTLKYKNRNDFFNMNLSIPTKPTPTEYNEITYENQNNQISCNAQKQAEIPCDVVKSCKNPNPTQTPYQLSESEMAVIYRDAYASAGRELLLRTINKKI
jgi:hypothetical protein